ncbi:MAG: phosphoribosylaminoimidazolesuccinocarboxamide synthase [Planctomycetota bacterium]|nr:MAG: phosphoribosylaminoimidazolesuccinocarboxamide synthase [Planctomycetota bacterium]
MAPRPVLEIDLPLTKVASGKVREVFAVDDEHLLFVASDRLSAYDVVLRSGIPDKGKILTQMAVFWFQQLAAAKPHHLVAHEVADFPRALAPYADLLAGRSLLVKRCKIIPIEAIVRGYLAGSGWAEYERQGSVCGIPLPPGLNESARLPEPLFTPSTKAEIGDHDENISPAEAAARIGESLADSLAKRAIALYQEAHGWAAERGIVLADTKFEFGLRDGQLILADEVLTPDSSRFWPADDYAPGRPQASFDKQYVRDWLTSINFDKQTPIALPDSVVTETRRRYLEAYRILSGRDPVL